MFKTYHKLKGCEDKENPQECLEIINIYKKTSEHNYSSRQNLPVY